MLLRLQGQGMKYHSLATIVSNTKRDSEDAEHRRARKGFKVFPARQFPRFVLYLPTPTHPPSNASALVSVFSVSYTRHSSQGDQRKLPRDP